MLCGIDEAGRGPLAGPVTAAAVILPADFDFSVLKDSKKLSEKKREAARKIICKDALFWSIGWASNEEIDSINILQATFAAMQRAYYSVYEQMRLSFTASSQNEQLCFEAPDIIVDGNLIPKIKNCRSIKALIKADDSIYEVMAASILAKTARDKMMMRYSWLYPEYGYESHKGYGTKKHIEAIKKYGLSPIARKSFSIKTLL